MKSQLLRILIVLVAFCGLIFPLVSKEGHRDASVGREGTVVYYYDSHGAYKAFGSFNAGTAHSWFRIVVVCNGVVVRGNWQSQPGPWYGSTATCPSGKHITGASWEFA